MNLSNRSESRTASLQQEADDVQKLEKDKGLRSGFWVVGFYTTFKNLSVYIISPP